MKASFEVETLKMEGLKAYGGLCAWTLARAHARSGDPVAIAAYLGSSDKFDRSITDFSERYADQNQRDFDAFVGAVEVGQAGGRSKGSEPGAQRVSASITSFECVSGIRFPSSSIVEPLASSISSSTRTFAR